MAQETVIESFKIKFQTQLLSWYRTYGRDLPWRQTCDPYQILVSEIFLHQTQVKTVLPIYKRFLEEFPTFEALASAKLSEVKAITDPLGYKVRGKWLHTIAQAVMDKHGGTLPDTLEELMELDGVGRYTAGAILSFTFKKRVPIVDTNVERIIRRVFGLEESPQNATTERQIWQLAEELLPTEETPQDIFDFNQGIMYIGALICQTQATCPICPLRLLCTRGRKFPRQRVLEEFSS